MTRQQGLLERLGAALGSDGDGRRLDEAARGRTILTVAAATPERAQLAAAPLKPFGSYAMRHYGELTVTDLLPDEAARATRPPRD